MSSSDERDALTFACAPPTGVMAGLYEYNGRKYLLRWVAVADIVTEAGTGALPSRLVGELVERVRSGAAVRVEVPDRDFPQYAAEHDNM